MTFIQKNNSNADRFVICLSNESESDEEEHKTSEVSPDFEKSVVSFLKKAREDVEANTLKSDLNIQQTNKSIDVKTKLMSTQKQNEKNTFSILESKKLHLTSSISNTVNIQKQKTSTNSKLPIQAISTVENKTKIMEKLTKWNNLLINNKKFVAKAIPSKKSLKCATPIKLPKTNLQSSTVKTTPSVS